MGTHTKYKTISHCHLDFSYRKPDGEFDYPGSALMLVECANGLWYIEQEFGNEYDRFLGIAKSKHDILTEVSFYPNEEAAAEAAVIMIKEIYPTTPDSRLEEFLAEYRTS
jgi:hypothetical protein